MGLETKNLGPPGKLWTGNVTHFIFIVFNLHNERIGLGYSKFPINVYVLGFYRK